MTIQIFENSYATVAEADEHFNNTIGGDSWVDSTEAVKEKALITATRVLEDFTWSGVVVDFEQPLAFPRVGSYYDPRVGKDISLDSPQALSRLKLALYSIANNLLTNPDSLSDEISVKSITVGPIQLSGLSNSGKIPSVVKTILSPMQKNAGSNSWWRAN